MREINDAGISLVKRWEGIMDGDPTTVNLDPYCDPVGIWTIGWGHALRMPDGEFVRRESIARVLYPDGITLEQAEVLLRADLMQAALDVSHLIKVPLSDNQFSALVSFQFNVGSLWNSTMRRALNEGNIKRASAEFGRWIKGRVKGVLQTLPGLVLRRAAERALFDLLPSASVNPSR